MKSQDKDYTVGGESTGVVTAGMAILVVASLFLLVAGFVQAESAVTQTAYFAASAVCGILARMMQAAVHHAKLMGELRRR